jgi:transcriptional regulator with XRE-family HTH domain
MSLTFDQSVARRVRALRARHGWSQQDLVDKLTNFGMPIDRSAIARLENGRRGVSLAETMHLAFALNVAPIHLLVDPDGEEPITPTPGDTLEPEEARKWIRGELPLVFQDPRVYFSEIPEAEFNEMRARARKIEPGEATPPESWIIARQDRPRSDETER